MLAASTVFAQVRTLSGYQGTDVVPEPCAKGSSVLVVALISSKAVSVASVYKSSWIRPAEVCTPNASVSNSSEMGLPALSGSFA